MKKNMGSTDRVIRTLIALVVLVLFATNIITGTVAVILLVLAGIFILTSIFGFCPIYALLGLNTCPKRINQ